jgi:rubrerythrin
MPEPDKSALPPTRSAQEIRDDLAARAAKGRGEDKVLCERCRTEMFRMHAVWRCPACGYKTDCCGW